MPEERAIAHVAVLGGSGFIGTQLTLNLLHMGYNLHLLINRTEPDYVSPRGQLNVYRGKIENKQALLECFQGCEIVYHLVGIIAETRDKTFQKTVADGTALVVEAAQEAGVKKIIYLSALGTAEDAPSLYHRSKWQAEEHVRRSGLDFTIFRPSVVYGPDDQFINMLAGMIRRVPVVPVIGDGQYRLQPVAVDELAAVMVMAAEKDFTSRKTYEIGGPRQLTYLEILDIIKQVLGVKRMNVYIPVWLARLAAAIMEKILRPAPLTTDQLNMMAAGSVCDQTEAEKEFGVEFSSLENKIVAYLGNKGK